MEEKIKEFVESKYEYKEEEVFKIKGTKKTKTVQEVAKELKIYLYSEYEKVTSNEDCLLAIKNYIRTISNKDETKLTEKEEKEQKDLDYIVVLGDNECEFPFKLSTKEGGNWFVHIIKNPDLRIVETVQTDNSILGLFDVFMNNNILKDWLKYIEVEYNKLHNHDFSAMVCVEKIRSQYILGSMKSSEKVMIGEVKTFSRDLLDWKLSWIDDSKIDEADETLIPTWRKFGDSLTNPEYSFKQFAAWVWIMFDDRACIKNRQCLWLYGDGFDGKSTIINMLKNIINNDITKTDGCGSLDGQSLNQFWAANVVDKILVCVNEVKDPDFLTKSYIHQWLGGDDVSVEMKGMTPYSKKLNARCVIASNVEPVVNKSENNQITRIIPIRIAKSYFDINKLNQDGKDVVENTYNEDLFAERWNFLKFCKMCFGEFYNREYNLIKFNVESMEKQLCDSDIDVANRELEEMLSKNSRLFYKTEDIKSFLKWFFGKHRVPSAYRGVSSLMTKLGIKLTDKNIPTKKNGYKIHIDPTLLSEFNSDTKYGFGGKTQMIGYIDGREKMENTKIEEEKEEEFNLPTKNARKRDIEGFE